VPKLSDMQKGTVIKPERIEPATEDWWNVKSGLNLSTFGYPDNFDATYPFTLLFYLDKNVRKILEVGLTLKFQKFRTYTKPLSHAHDVTVSAHNHTVSIGNHTHDTTLSNHTHGVTTSNHTHTVGNHTHNVTIPMDNSTSGTTVYAVGSGSGNLRCSGGSNISAFASSSGGSTTSSSGGGESVTSGGGGGTTVSSSSGGAATPTTSDGSSTTQTSTTTAGAELAVFEDTYPAGVTLSLDGVNITSNLGGAWNPTVGSDTFYDLDLTPFVSEGGMHIIQLTTSQRGRCLPLLWVKSIISK
jgi:hypothetical protein